jgi:hypothetical protein
MGAILGFVLHLRGKGLWIGFIAGSILQSTLLCLITGFTNWKKQVCSPSTYFLKNAYFVYRKCLICLISKKLDIINIVETLSLPCTFQNTLHHKSMRCFIYLKISLEEKNKL